MSERRSSKGERNLGRAAAVTLVAAATLAVAPPAGAASTPAPVGVVVTWGAGLSGGLGTGSTADAAVPTPVALPGGVQPLKVASASGDAGHTLVIGADHQLYAWGANSSGQLGTGSASPLVVTTPVRSSLPSGVQASSVSAGGTFSLLVSTDHRLFAFGDNSDHQLGQLGASADLASSATPLEVTLPGGAVPASAAAGTDMGAALSTTGVLYTWGANGEGQLGQGGTSTWAPPAAVSFTGATPGATVVEVALGQDFSAARLSDGTVWTWGAGGLGQLGNGTQSVSAQTTPLALVMPPGVQATALAASTYNGAFLGSDGQVWVWGDNSSGVFAGNGSTFGCGIFACSSGAVAISNFPVGIQPQSISVGEREVLVSATDGNLYAWGNNGDLQTGTGDTVDLSVSTPTKVALPEGLRSTTEAQLLYQTGVAIAHAAPVTLTLGSPIATVAGQHCTATLSAAGTPTPKLSLTSALPTGWGFVDHGDGTATLNCSSRAALAGIHRLTVVATNAYGQARGVVAVTVEVAPGFSALPVLGLRPHAAFAVVLRATGFPLPTLSARVPRGVHWVATPGALVLRGVAPALGGTLAALVTATNGVAPSATLRLTLVSAIAPRLFAPTTLAATVGRRVSVLLTASGMPAPTFSAPGAAALGLRLVAHGPNMAQLVGTPVPGSGGIHRLVVTASNGYLARAVVQLSVAEAPRFTSQSPQHLTAGNPGILEISAVGYPTAIHLRVLSAPSGLQFSDLGGGVGELRGSIAAPGTYRVVLAASNAAGTSEGTVLVEVASASTAGRHGENTVLLN